MSEKTLTFYHLDIRCSAQGAEVTMDKTMFSARIMVHGKLGVHARVAAKLAQEAQKYASDVTIRHNDREADAKSVLDILFLAAGQGSTIELTAFGKDSEDVVTSLVSCLHQA